MSGLSIEAGIYLAKKLIDKGDKVMIRASSSI